ncbi:DUF7560 family zinc ribbon protein [Halovenus rubra]|uniref:DUF7560 family zinc ribbon protein n=1 Tax=Halovenus rubra TaxID=869890 RepID=UPI003F5F30A8
MSDGSSERSESEESVDEYSFTCPACSQEISVNSEMKTAILANGCPVCTESVDTGCFDT